MGLDRSECSKISLSFFLESCRTRKKFRGLMAKACKNIIRKWPFDGIIFMTNFPNPTDHDNCFPPWNHAKISALRTCSWPFRWNITRYSSVSFRFKINLRLYLSARLTLCRVRSLPRSQWASVYTTWYYWFFSKLRISFRRLHCKF